MMRKLLLAVAIIAIASVTHYEVAHGVSKAFWTYRLAHIIEGESGAAGCPVEGHRAIAHVDRNTRGNVRWYGWESPSPAAWHAATYPGADLTHGAVHAFSNQDLNRADVQAIIRPLKRTLHIDCGNGLGLNFYARR
jgi:hypothetical protein